MDEIRNIEWREYGVTDLEPATLLATLIASAFLVGARRSRAVVPLLFVCCFLPSAQRIVIASLDFNMVRIVVLFGWMRVLLRGELRRFPPTPVDVVFVLWLASASFVHVAREATVGALVYRLGTSFDALGVFLLLRLLIRSPDDVRRAFRSIAWVTVPLGGFMLAEWVTGYNAFSLLGGVQARTAIRDGELRCMGAFSHPIMAGSYGASVLPVALGLYLADPRSRSVALAAAVSAVVIVLACGSGGPLVAMAAGLGGWMLWSFRRRLGAIRWAAAAAAIVVHFAREKPIWHLVGRASSLVGGTGWHRYRLIDAFVNRFDEWWLFGVASTAHWGWGLQDVTNQFVANGVQGGLLTLVLFVVLLACAFAAVGRTLRRSCHPMLDGRVDHRLLAWGTGVALFVHCVSFISVTYFGQMIYVFYAGLALIAAAATGTERTAHGRSLAAASRRSPPRHHAVPGWAP